MKRILNKIRRFFGIKRDYIQYVTKEECKEKLLKMYKDRPEVLKAIEKTLDEQERVKAGHHFISFF